ncbi:uncharacterized protein LOC124164017 [Ischnura elegans]|uniref:uncharacterized protein LOC124164017 n=1 Tax=Ischnura elegans TaxID=197161 RepID=UPI001ED87BA2|nr:uncharacterized protein LOC124164017 [Ischnura elegans]
MYLWHFILMTFMLTLVRANEGNNPTVELGQDCIVNANCCTNNAKCIQGKCQCENSYVERRGNKFCQDIFSTVELGQECNEDANCRANNTICIEGKCQCEHFYDEREIGGKKFCEGVRLLITRENGIYLWTPPKNSKKLVFLRERLTNGFRMVSLAISRPNANINNIYYNTWNDQKYKDEIKYFTLHGTTVGSIGRPIKVADKAGPNATTYIRSLAFHEDTKTLYWTNMKTRNIWKCVINKANCEPILFKQFNNEHPAEIEVHNRFVLWTNDHLYSPSVTAEPINGAGGFDFRNDTEIPIGISVDDKTGRVYWASKLNGAAFTVNSALLTDEKTTSWSREFMDYNYRRPIALAFSPPNTLYWTDWNRHTIWSLRLGGKYPKAVQVPNTDFPDWPMDIAVLPSAA